MHSILIPADAIILVVEDNEDFRFYLKDNLKSRYTVIEAIDGREGWHKVKQYAPHLVVSDIMMPHINGIELSRRIKNDPRTAKIPIILLTAMDNEEAQLEGYKSGINDYISKPFTFEILGNKDPQYPVAATKTGKEYSGKNGSEPQAGGHQLCRRAVHEDGRGSSGEEPQQCGVFCGRPEPRSLHEPGGHL